MESNRTVTIKQDHIPKILALGLMLSSLLIIFSVDQFYRDSEWIKLIISTCIFTAMLFVIRWLNR